jgi:hypothetical protein
LIGAFFTMKRYIIKEDLLNKVKALLKVSKIKNVVVEYNEVAGVLEQLEQLSEARNKKKTNSYYFDVFFNGVSPVNETLYEKQFLFSSRSFLSTEEIEEIISHKFNYVKVSAKVREIKKEEFQLLKEDVIFYNV